MFPIRMDEGLKLYLNFREYPCDSYVAVINVTLMATGCPRPEVHEAALQLLQVLDKRFFGAVLPLATDGEYPPNIYLATDLLCRL